MQKGCKMLYFNKLHPKTKPEGGGYGLPNPFYCLVHIGVIYNNVVHKGRKRGVPGQLHNDLRVYPKTVEPGGERAAADVGGNKFVFGNKVL